MTAVPATALLVVDVQRDFCVGGALEVPDGDRVVPPLNALMGRLHQVDVPIYASRDWHPAQSAHFRPHGGPWPIHCVADTPGAEFHPDLALPERTVIVSKGQVPAADGYSAFEGQTAEGVTFERELRERKIDRLIVGGLATDYCVAQSVLDARRLGFDVTVATDAIAGVDLAEGDSERALERMQKAGAALQRSEEIEPSFSSLP